MMSVIKLSILLLCSFFAATNAQVLEEGSQCATPDRRPGLCVDIRACNDLLRILRTRSNDPDAVDYLRSSTCGFIGSIPLVCCPKQSSATTSPPITQRTTTTTTERITRAPIILSSTENGSDEDSSEDPLIGARYSLPRFPYCGISNTSNEKIVGGRPARLGEFPWIVALGYKNSRNPDLPKWLCGGSLITEKHVLTAGHCVSKRNDLYLVRAGELDLYDDADGAKPVDVAIEKVKLHEEYNPTSVTNDIAIITVQRPLKGFLIMPVCLPLDEPLRSRDFVRYTPIVSGWGAIYFNGPSSARLQAVMLPVVSNEQCKNAFSAFRNVIIDHRVLCAGYLRGKKDSCQGDSGGPLILAQGQLNDVNKYYQIGVVSYGFRCAEEGYPGVYTRVTQYLDWIQRNLD